MTTTSCNNTYNGSTFFSSNLVIKIKMKPSSLKKGTARHAMCLISRQSTRPKRVTLGESLYHPSLTQNVLADIRSKRRAETAWILRELASFSLGIQLWKYLPYRHHHPACRYQHSSITDTYKKLAEYSQPLISYYTFYFFHTKIQQYYQNRLTDIIQRYHPHTLIKQHRCWTHQMRPRHLLYKQVCCARKSKVWTHSTAWQEDTEHHYQAGSDNLSLTQNNPFGDILLPAF